MDALYQQTKNRKLLYGIWLALGAALAITTLLQFLNRGVSGDTGYVLGAIAGAVVAWLLAFLLSSLLFWGLVYGFRWLYERQTGAKF